MTSSFPPLARAAELLGGEVHNREILCPGPKHSDSDRSLSVKPSNDDPEGFVVHSFANDDWKACREHVRKKCGLPEPKSTKQRNGNGKAWTTISEHIYRDESGAPYLKVRKAIDGNGKEQYPQSHWDGNGWAKNKPKGPKIPYRLPELLAAPTGEAVYFVEGEACADAVAKIVLVATTASEGASAKWAPELTQYFEGRRVIILIDSDEPGRKHGQKVARALYPVAQSVRVIDLYPDRDDGSDIADFLKTDTAGVKLMKVVSDAPYWEPGADNTADNAKDETGDEAKSGGEGDDEDTDTEQVIRKKQADTLLELASAAELFHTSAGDAYADVMVAGHRETHRVRSGSFKLWLMHRYYENCAGAPNSDAVQSARNVIEARARFEGPEIEVHLRVAEHERMLYLDLADEGWRAVEIDAEGWRIVSSPPVRFRRAPGMLRLPEPVHGGSINALRSLLNVRDNADFVLVVAWLLAAMRGRGPYPVMVLNGEHGTAKTTVCKMLRALIDPNTGQMRALPREDRDAFIAANNGYVLAFDNVSGLPPWISDTLCRLSTGGGFSTRQLFSDDAEMLFDAMRPIILNGIEDFATRPDLVDRAIMLTLDVIPEDRQRLEEGLWADLYRERPRLLGVLLDVVAHGLRELPNVKLPKLPRMADFAMWASACETALWPVGTFAEAYELNRQDAVSGTIEADLVANAVRAFMAERTVWEGTASSLLDALGQLITEAQRRGKGWPTIPHHLTGRLRRAAPGLRKIGIKIDFVREGKRGTRTIYITRRPENEGQSASAASAASVPNDFSKLELTLVDRAASASASVSLQDDVADARADAHGGGSVSGKPLKIQQADAADAAGAHFPTLSDDDDLDLPAFLRRCDHCGQPASPADPLNPYDWRGRPDGILLHERCEEPWFDTRGAS